MLQAPLHGKVARLLRERFGLAVITSTVTSALHRVARQAQPTYAALCETIRGRGMSHRLLKI